MHNYKAEIYHYAGDITQDSKSVWDCTIEQPRLYLSREFLDTVRTEMEWAAIREGVQINALIYRDNTVVCGMGLIPHADGSAFFTIHNYNSKMDVLGHYNKTINIRR